MDGNVGLSARTTTLVKAKNLLDGLLSNVAEHDLLTFFHEQLQEADIGVES